MAAAAVAAALSMEQSPPPPPPGVSPPSAPLITLRRASLYVGDLHPDVTEADLTQVFGNKGALHSVRLCRDRVSRNSLCYAYVNFLFPSDATRALASLNHTKLRGKTMRIMWCQRDPLPRKNGVANLYVKNLCPSITSARLEEIFSKYGMILSCKVAEDNGKSKGFGFVQFDSEDSATTALDALNNTVLEGKALCVCKFIRKSERKAASEKTFTNLYFKNLDGNVTENFLKEKFSAHGTVCSIVIVKDDKGKSRGFGFVKFSSHEEAKKAVECLNGALLGSKNLYVERAQKKAEREEILRKAYEIMYSNNSVKSKPSNLFVKNLNVSFDDLELKEIFSAYGKVTSAKVMHNEDGVSKGFGFVCFSCPEEAKRALDSLNGTAVRGKVLYVGFAQSREERYRQLQSSQGQYPKQSIHAPFWNMFDPQYYPLYYNFPPPPPFSMPYFSSFQPRLCQSFRRSVSESFPFEELGKFSNHLQGPIKQSQQEPIKAGAYQYHPKKLITTTHGSTQCPIIGSGKLLKPTGKLGSKTVCGAFETSTTGSGSLSNPTIGFKQDPKVAASMQQKPSCKLGNKSVYCATETCTTGSESVTSAATSSQWICKKKIGTMQQPFVKNSQPGHAAKRSRVLVEMNMQEILNSQNPLALHVEKAIKMTGPISRGASDSNTT
ncbi:hypothetical protein ACH5RR_007995 [Cinchona calisaya]|uniref:RRM domain-containing protein n=1 Tax=Cinchona calisaya TaxID=153742 RepID=A0ABD3AAU6_9GENT